MQSRERAEEGMSSHVSLDECSYLLAIRSLAGRPSSLLVSVHDTISSMFLKPLQLYPKSTDIRILSVTHSIQHSTGYGI